MGGIVSTLFGGGIEGAGKGIAAVVNAIKGKNPEDAAKLQELLQKHEDLVIQTEADLKKAEMDSNVKLNETAGQNIRAEAAGDWFSRDARPAVVWGGLLILAWNYMVIPLVGIKWHVQPVNFPDMFWWVWGTVVTGYVFARTSDKLFGGSGGTMQLPFGVKLDSKGD
jgi:hypothetical protein